MLGKVIEWITLMVAPKYCLMAMMKSLVCGKLHTM
jgi:hypothetical protein